MLPKLIHKQPVLKLKPVLQQWNQLQSPKLANPAKKKLLSTQSTKSNCTNKSENLTKWDINSLKKIQMLKFQATLQPKEFSKNKKKLANKLKMKRNKRLRQPRESMRRWPIPQNHFEVIPLASTSETSKTQLKCIIALSLQMSMSKLHHHLTAVPAMMLLPLIVKLSSWAQAFTKTSQKQPSSSQSKMNKLLVWSLWPSATRWRRPTELKVKTHPPASPRPHLHHSDFLKDSKKQLPQPELPSKSHQHQSWISARKSSKRARTLSHCLWVSNRRKTVLCRELWMPWKLITTQLLKKMKLISIKHKVCSNHFWVDQVLKQHQFQWIQSNTPNYQTF